jgi:methylenetetrahydrofolate dehydrogenase (NADP+) / methenyltetrahydrofolate cyclohydrolase
MKHAKIIDGKFQANQICDRLKQHILQLAKDHAITPGLAVILAGDDPASHIYVTNKLKKAKEISMNIFSHFLPSDVKQAQLISLIERLNSDKSVHGILLQIPVPPQIDQFKAINAIDPRKDVDGFTVQNVGLLNTWQDCLEPSTPQGALRLIKSVLGDDLGGKKAVVLGRSLIVGRPMASMLVRESCTVTLLHSKSLNIAKECTSADILVSAIGQPGFITKDLTKLGACIIDVGITRIDGEILGDVDFESVSKIAGYITPVPGGVGPMTVACMLENTFKAMCKQHNLVIKDF